jgi:WD40 repeat protein
MRRLNSRLSWATYFIYAVYLLVVAAKPSMAEDGLPKAATPKLDQLGDPLPDGALFRFGTQRFRPPSGVDELALSPDEKIVVTQGNELIAWDTATGKELWRSSGVEGNFSWIAASYGIRSLAFAAKESQTFYMLSRMGSVLAWDATSGQHKVLPIKLANPPGQQHPCCLAIDVTSDGQVFALGVSSGVTVCHRDGEMMFAIKNEPKEKLEMSSGDRLKFGGHFSFVRFSPDEKLLAVVTSDTPEAIQLFDVKTGMELRQIKLKSRLVRLAFSPDSKRIVGTERDVAARMYSVDTGDRIWERVIPPKPNSENYTSAVAFSPDGKTIAVGAPLGNDELIYLLDPETGEELDKLVGHAWKPWALAFTADSKMLYSSGWDGAVRRWDLTTRKQLPLPEGFQSTGATAASPDGRLLAFQDDSSRIHLVDATTGIEQRVLQLPPLKFSQLKFSPDSTVLAGGGSGGDEIHVVIWQLQDDKVIRHWKWPKGRDPHSDVEALEFSPDDKRLAVAVFRQSLAHLWDVEQDAKLAEMKHPQIYGLSFSADGKTLLTAGWDSIVRLWDGETGDLQRQLEVKDAVQKNNDLRMYTVCCSPNGDEFATVHMDNYVRIWRMDDLKQRSEFEAPGVTYGTMNYSPDGLWLAIGGSDGSVSVWNPINGAKVWDVRSHKHYVYTVNFGRDSRTVFSGGEDGVCYLWNLKRDNKPPNELSQLWEELSGEDSAIAFQAMFSLAERSDEAIALIGEQLRPVKSIADLDRLIEGESSEEAQRRKRLQKMLIQKDSRTESRSAVQRAISVLEQIGTGDARKLLEELVAKDPDGKLASLARAPLARSSRDRR